MISEFEELSDKIDQLAEMTNALRRENAQLRQANAALVVENMGYQRRLSEASGRIVALLEKVPALEDESKSDLDEEADDHLPEKEDVR
jgi:FtsZ-binding cell division protein ZapB